jgi:AbrB family looped-hinge helix DNA binding protein
MTETVTRIGEGGRVVIPSPLRRALGLRPGDQVVLVLRDQEIALLTPKQAIAQARAIVRRRVPAGRSLAAELIRERRREAGDE